MKASKLIVLSLLSSVVFLSSCGITGSDEQPSQSQNASEINSVKNPYSIPEVIAMIDAGTVPEDGIYVTGKAKDVYFNRESCRYNCNFEGYQMSDPVPFSLYNTAIDVAIKNYEEVRVSHLEDENIVFFGTNCLKKEISGKLVYQLGGSLSKDTVIKTIGKDIPARSKEGKTPASGKVDIKQTYKDYSGNNNERLTYVPQVGEPKIMIVPIWFTDSDNYISEDKKETYRDDLYKVFFGTNEETGWRSVKTYYEEESSDLLKIQGTVLPWWECGRTSKSIDNQNTKIDLVKSAMSYVESIYTKEELKTYDTNDDGYYDGMVFVIGSPRQNGELRSHCFSIDNYRVSSASLRASYVLWTDMLTFYGNDISSRIGKDIGRDGDGDTENCLLDAHIYIHEFGHMLGLKDYYDYTGQYDTCGDFTMQDKAAGGHDPFSVMALGWTDPYIPSESCTIEIGAFQTTREIILLTPKWNRFDSAFDEYLLLELYTPTGLNKFDVDYFNKQAIMQGPNAIGLRVWHVDARLTAYLGDGKYSSTLTNDVLDQYYYLTAMSNTYYDEKNPSNASSYRSVLGTSYADYNLLQLIRNDTAVTFRPNPQIAHFSEDSLFKDGDHFDLTTFRDQFKMMGKFNNGNYLNWSFDVSITGEGENAKASITLVKG